MATSSLRGPAATVADLDRVLTVDRDLLRIGSELEGASAILGRVSDVFRSLFEEFQSGALATAAASLAAASSHIARLGDVAGNQRPALEALTGSATAITRPLARMRDAMRSIGMLTINARIEVSALAGTGEDFTAFTAEIGELLAVAKDSLANFDRDLTGLHDHIGDAYAGQADFDALKGEAIRSMLERLRKGAESIAQHHASAAKGAQEVDERSRQVATRIGAAVMALQIGDITRQRVEHVLAALSGLESRVGGLPDGDARRLALIVHRLASAQLAAAARELDAAIGSMIGAHSGLASDARMIARLGAAALGGARPGELAFLPELERDVLGARESLERYRVAKTGLERLVALLSDAVAGLDGHIAMIRSLDTDLRIMGLNTTLKCSRLGQEGAALSAIAHELRAFGNQTSDDAGEITGLLTEIVEVAGALHDSDRAGGTAEIDALCEEMTGSVAILAGAGTKLEAALHGLERDCAEVAALLERTLPGIGLNRDAVALMESAADALARAADDLDVRIDDLSADERETLAVIAGRYTMAAERDIHDALLRTWRPDAPPGDLPTQTTPPPQAPSVDDFLF